MTIEFKLPELGENIEGGDIINILIKEGDNINEGQSILEIEAGKASMEIPSPLSGSIKKILVSQGDAVSVGQHIITFNKGDSSEKKEPAPVKKEPAPVKEEPAPVKEEPVPVKEQNVNESKNSQFINKPISAAPNVRRLARELGLSLIHI